MVERGVPPAWELFNPSTLSSGKLWIKQIESEELEAEVAKYMLAVVLTAVSSAGF